MKETLLHYARYNQWANKELINILTTIGDNLLDAVISSSFPSIRLTAYHSWGAEDLWLQRLQLKDKPVWAPGAFQGNFQEACILWQQSSKALINYTETAEEGILRENISFLRDEVQHMYPPSKILNHVFNHATYHRGQLVTMLRQSGIKDIPATDLSIFN
ncbi:MAG: DNA polymerase [Taibaiella sp.]|nr:DNA polymerase [Taibaiella sp.]